MRDISFSFLISGEDMIYLYPDLRTAIIGKFHSEKHTLIKGKEACVEISFHKDLNLNQESVIVLRLLPSQDKFTNGSKDPSSSSITGNRVVDIIIIEIHIDIFPHGHSFIYPDAPNSKCIRYKFKVSNILI